MSRHGELFPDEPRTLDELLENMARRMAAMSALMASLSPEQRDELARARRAGDAGHGPRVRGRPPRARTCRRRSPEMPLGRGRGAGIGEGPACRCRRRSTRWNASTTTRSSTGRCRATMRAPRLDDVDEDAVRRTLGDTAAQDLRRLKQIERAARGGRSRAATAGPARGHAARCPQARGTRAHADLRGARSATARARTSRATPAVWPSRRARHARGASATTVSSPCSARCSTRSARSTPGEPVRLVARRLRDGRGGAAHRDGDRACCSTCRSRCRCAGTSSTRRRWRSRCTR